MTFEGLLDLAMALRNGFRVLAFGQGSERVACVVSTTQDLSDQAATSKMLQTFEFQRPFESFDAMPLGSRAGSSSTPRCGAFWCFIA